MEQNNEVVKVSYKNWLQSAQKWVSILEKVQKKEIFGRRYLRDEIASVCGYCYQFLNRKVSDRCQNCFLFKEKRLLLTSDSDKIYVCYCQNIKEAPSHFWLFVSEMEHFSPNFKIAEYHCSMVLNAILEDCPDKKKAVKKGIVFE